jgi:hypothetical protein
MAMGLMNAPEASDSNLSEVLQSFVTVVGPRTLQHGKPIYARGRLGALGRFPEQPRTCLTCRLITVLSRLLTTTKHMAIRALLTESSCDAEF